MTEQEPPAGSGQSSMIYPNRQGAPRLDGITRALANECATCELSISSGSSSSSVKISRQFGNVSPVQCGRYTKDLKRVREKTMSFQEFITNLRSGQYYRNLNNGYCELIDFPAEADSLDKFDEGKLRSVRIQKLSSGGFSTETKAKLEPSVPFEMTFNGEAIRIKTMTLYHPCPLRLDGFQPDAVLSLNDPSFEASNYVILVPLVARNTADPSVDFINKIASQLSSVSSPDPSGQYPIRQIPTGSDWTLSKVFSIEPIGDGSLAVTNGYYEWKGMPALDRVREETPEVISYVWKESGAPSPRYIMLDSPVAIASGSLASITQSLPVTPSSDAIHAVLYSDNPFQRGIVHKQGPPGSSCRTKETFTDLQGAYGLGTQEEDEACDAWTLWARASSGQSLSTAQILELVFNISLFFAMLVGAYVAFTAITREYDQKYVWFSEGVGKVVAAFAKSVQQKASVIRGLTNPRAGMTPASTNSLASVVSAVTNESTRNVQANTEQTTASARGSGRTLRRGRGHGGLTRRGDR